MEKSIYLKHGDKFNSRAEISSLLGGDSVKGIAKSNATQKSAILLFANEEELYADYFYTKTLKKKAHAYDKCLYTGIGRKGHQDSLKNSMYSLNLDVLSHKKNGKTLLLFEKRITTTNNPKYYFIGEYILEETHQNTQPDETGEMRRVFVFHLEKHSDEFESKLIK
ncbi:MAG: hypothetical protein FWE07_02880 [Turicibacter sp.]|nr:hypothetical protein [Turicibacter sp.]